MKVNWQTTFVALVTGFIISAWSGSATKGADRVPALVQVGLKSDQSPAKLHGPVTQGDDGTKPSGNVHWYFGDPKTPTPLDRTTSKTKAGFVVPSEPGKTVHVILEVADEGSPPLAHYRRIVFAVAEDR